MSEYIIRNCKALISNYVCELYSQKGIHLMTYCYCKDKNCLLKKVIGLCNDGKEQETDPLNSSGISLAQKILDLFDIEEIRE